MSPDPLDTLHRIRLAVEAASQERWLAARAALEEVQGRVQPLREALRCAQQALDAARADAGGERARITRAGELLADGARLLELADALSAAERALAAETPALDAALQAAEREEAAWRAARADREAIARLREQRAALDEVARARRDDAAQDELSLTRHRARRALP